MESFFLARNGKEYGPFKVQELRVMAREGRIAPEDKIRKGQGAWVMASRVKGLFQTMPEAPEKTDTPVGNKPEKNGTASQGEIRTTGVPGRFQAKSEDKTSTTSSSPAKLTRENVAGKDTQVRKSKTAEKEKKRSWSSTVLVGMVLSILLPTIGLFGAWKFGWFGGGKVVEDARSAKQKELVPLYPNIQTVVSNSLEKSKPSVSKLPQNEARAAIEKQKADDLTAYIKQAEMPSLEVEPKAVTDLDASIQEKPSFSLFTALAQPRKTGPYKSREEMIESCSPAIAILSTVKVSGIWRMRGTGSGFLVAPKLVATNRHVVGEVGDTVRVRFPSAKGKEGKSFKGVVIGYHSDRDLALVQLSEDPTIKPLILGHEKDLKKGQEVVVIGSPNLARDKFDLAENAVRVGPFSSILQGFEGYEGGPKRNLLEIGVAINKGNSGGPVLDAQGKVVGVAAAKSTVAEAVAFAEPVSELLVLGDETTPGKLKAQKGPAYSGPGNQEQTSQTQDAGSGLVVQIIVQAKTAIPSEMPEYQLGALDKSGVVVASAPLQAAQEISIGQKAQATAHIRFGSVDQLAKVTGFRLTKIPDPRETAFVKSLSDALRSGDIKATRSAMDDYETIWKPQFLRICDEYKSNASAASRAAAAVAISACLGTSPELQESFDKLLEDSDPIVIKAAVEAVPGLDILSTSLVSKVFEHASSRKDMAGQASLAVISKIHPQTKELVDLFLGQMESKEVDVRRAAANGLVGAPVPPKEGLVLIKKILAEQDVPLQTAGVKILGQFTDSGRDESIDLLLKVASRQEQTLKTVSDEVLEKFVPFRKGDVPTLGKYLSPPNPNVQVRVCKALESIGPDSSPVESDLANLLGSNTEKTVRSAALGAVAVVNNPKPQTIEKVKSATMDAMPDVRKAGFETLGRLNRKANPVGELLDGLADVNKEAANAARLSLISIKPPVGAEDLEILESKMNHQSPEVRRMAYHVLAEIGEQANKLSEKAVQGLDDKDQSVTYDAMRIMAKTKHLKPEVTKKISLILDKTCVGVRGTQGQNSPKAESKSFEKIFEDLSPSVAVIQTSDGSGSGFLVTPRLLATNKHVSEYVGEQVVVKFPSAKLIARQDIPGKNIWVHPTRDLAIIEIPVDLGLKIIPLRPESELKPGQEIMSIGSPGFGSSVIENSLRKGTFSSLQKWEMVGQVAEMDLSINAGNSGGPVFDQTGHVFCLVTSKARGKERIAFGEPVSELLPILKNSPTAPKAVMEANSTNGDRKNPVSIEKPPITSLETSIAALEYLADLGPEAKSVIPTLRKVLSLGTSLEMQKSAMHVVANMREDAVPLIPDLIKRFEYPGRNAFMANNLGEYREIFLNNKNNQMVREAIASMGAPAAKELGKILYSREPSERFGALITLQSLNENAKEAMPSIYRLTLNTNERSPLVLQQARETYGRIEALIKK